MNTFESILVALAILAVLAFVFAPRRQILTEIHIDATPDEVWNVLADLAGYREWNPFLVSAEGELKEGATLTHTMHPANGSPMTFQPTMLRVSPARELRWLGRLLLPRIFDGEHYFLLESHEGGTRLVHGEKFAGILLWLLNTQRFAADFEAMNRALKQRVEARIVPG